MPTLIAATVIVMISNGILKIPNKPNTEPAVIKFGISAINVIFIDLKIISNIKPIAA